MKNVTFEELLVERFCPPKGFTLSNRIFSPWKKSFRQFSFLRFFFFDSAERAASPRDAIFPCNRAVCRSPPLLALPLGVSARLLLVVMRERKWRREKRVKPRRTFRHWQPRRETLWLGSTGRNGTPMRFNKRAARKNTLKYRPCTSESFSESAGDSEPPVLSFCLQLTVWISEASWRWRQNEGPVDKGTETKHMCFATRQKLEPLHVLNGFNYHWIDSRVLGRMWAALLLKPLRPASCSWASLQLPSDLRRPCTCGSAAWRATVTVSQAAVALD